MREWQKEAVRGDSQSIPRKAAKESEKALKRNQNLNNHMINRLSSCAPYVMSARSFFFAALRINSSENYHTHEKHKLEFRGREFLRTSFDYVTSATISIV